MAVEMYCWHCDTIVPMLDEDEYARLWPALEAAYQEIHDNWRRKLESPDAVPRGDCNDAALAMYRQLSGRAARDVSEIGHHLLANMGLPCRDCGKPMRRRSDERCAACGGPRVDDDPRELADPDTFAHTIDFEPGLLGRIFRRGQELVLEFPAQRCYSRSEGENPLVIPEFRCALVLTGGRIDFRRFRLPMRFEGIAVAFHRGERRCFLPVNFAAAGPVSISLFGAGATRLLATGDHVRLEVGEQAGVVHGWTEAEYSGPRGRSGADPVTRN